jgi:hypothetical protein
MPHPYQHVDGSPRLRDSWLLYLDALGTKARANSLTDAVLRERFGLEAWKHRFLFHRNQAEHRRALYFTDNVVVGVPADAEARDPIVTLFEMLDGAASYVVGMAIEAGITVRGAVTFRPAYIDDVVVHDPLASVHAAHGRALIEAVQIEEARARVPRVVIASSVIAEVRRCGAQRGLAPLAARHWLVDDDGVVFLDHLGSELLFEPTMASDIPRDELLRRYARFISAGLKAGGPSLSKYEWLRSYYDWAVQEYGDGTRLRDGPPRSFERARC